MSRDSIYAEGSGPPGPFEFNAEVAAVFPDMLERSIPGYAMTIEAIGSLARRYVARDTNCYDLGCSLGAAAMAMRDNIESPGCRVTAVDSAAAMVERCRTLVTPTDTVAVSVIESDLRDITVANASMVVLNYTLQFLPVAERLEVLQMICSGTNPGGILVLSEKVADDDATINDLLVDLHHSFKRRNAYSDLEISRKRAALENVLIPESIQTHRERLAAAGFSHSGVWSQHFNFVSLIAIR